MAAAGALATHGITGPADTTVPFSVKLNTGADFPTLGLGTWKSEKGKVKEAVIIAVEAGYRHIDCAAGYGNEGEVGEALAELFERGVVKREDVFVTSKLWVTEWADVDAAAALAKTLADLKLAYLDLFLVHWPFFIRKGAPFPAEFVDRLGYDPERLLGTWRALEREVDAGRVRALGISNATPKKLERLIADARIPPAVNQVELHPYLQQTAMVEWCRAHGIVVTAYSPLGSPDRPARLISEDDPVPLANEVIVRIAAAHGVTPAQVLIRWAIQRGTVVIPKSVTPSRIRDNFAVWTLTLSEDEMRDIAAIDRHHRLIKGVPFAVEGQDWHELWDEPVPGVAEVNTDASKGRDEM